jgi:hypothetical protein
MQICLRHLREILATATNWRLERRIIPPMSTQTGMPHRLHRAMRPETGNDEPREWDGHENS